MDHAWNVRMKDAVTWAHQCARSSSKTGGWHFDGSDWRESFNIPGWIYNLQSYRARKQGAFVPVFAFLRMYNWFAKRNKRRMGQRELSFWDIIFLKVKSEWMTHSLSQCKIGKSPGKWRKQDNFWDGQEFTEILKIIIMRRQHKQYLILWKETNSNGKKNKEWHLEELK